MSNAIKAGEAFVEYSLRDKKLRKGLARISKYMLSIGKRLQSIGKVGVAVGSSIAGAFAGAAAIFAKTGSSLFDMSKRSKLSVEGLQEIGHAAIQNGSSMKAVEKGAKSMSKFLLNVKRGSMGASQTLSELGLTYADLAKLSPEERFEKLGEAISRIADPDLQKALSMKVFGGAGAELLPILGNIKQLRVEARKLGLVMSTEDATAADRLGDAMDIAWQQATRVVQVIGAAVAGPLSDFLEWSQNLLATVIQWVGENRSLVQGLLAGVAVVTAISAALFGAGVFFSMVAVAATGLSVAAGAVASVLAAILSPLGLVVAGVSALAVWFATSTTAGQDMVTNLGTYFGQLWTIAKDTFGAIAAALSGGDIHAAGAVLWAGLKVLWLTGTQNIRELWIEATDVVKRTMTNLVFDVEGAWITLVSKLKKVWSEFQGWWQDAFDVVVFNLAAIGESEGVQQELQRQLDENIMQRENDRKAGNRGIDAERDKALATLDAARATATDDRNRSKNEQISAAEKALAEANAAYGRATAVALKIGEATAQQKAAGAAAEEGKKKAEGVTNALTGASSAGIFNVAALQSLQASGTSIQEEIAANTKRGADAAEKSNKRERTMT